MINHYHVFMNHKNEYARVVNKSLAFGNTAKIIIFVDDISSATKFGLCVNSINPDAYYTKWDYEKLIIENLKKVKIKVTETYEIVE